MPVHATAARAGWVPSSGNIKARSGALALPHDDRAVIEIQILDPQLQPSLIRMPVPYEAGRQTMLAFQKTEDANHFIRGQHHRQAPRRPRSSDLLKPGGRSVWQHLAVEEQQGRQCLTMRGDRNLALVRQPGQKCLDFAAAQGCRVTHTVETDEGTNPVDISLFGW